ncbi:uncharacterized protein LOC103998427 isoform X2 [Musa acuminata AAA Group]|uniref:uncharacterized protein LOC103998427 isoform X2 n=1 Tax=Musa acuminata AAA Group TaxID=214697 RepID=UPI0031E16A55
MVWENYGEKQKLKPWNPEKNVAFEEQKGATVHLSSGIGSGRMKGLFWAFRWWLIEVPDPEFVSPQHCVFVEPRWNFGEDPDSFRGFISEQTKAGIKKKRGIHGSGSLVVLL